MTEENPGDNARKALQGFVERIEKMEEERATIADDIKETYAEAKAAGFDSKVLRKVIQLRKMDPKDRQEYLQTIDFYLDNLEGAAPSGTAAAKQKMRERKEEEGGEE